jgi:hypothetical protein
MMSALGTTAGEPCDGCNRQLGSSYGEVAAHAADSFDATYWWQFAALWPYFMQVMHCPPKQRAAFVTQLSRLLLG